ncbi:type IV secretory system conjugative DNA transfer family protein [Sporomusa aerivorans]|uniref:type IV secretory system conjugative DNA transfer family protein n=1 Tax=Sporomusa aerivorans TaxID=204936 RepID=UPI003529E0A0
MEQPKLRGLEKNKEPIIDKILRLLLAVLLIPICGYGIWWIVQTFMQYGVVQGSMYVIAGVVGVAFLMAVVVGILGQILFGVFRVGILLLFPAKKLIELLIWPFKTIIQLSFNAIGKIQKPDSTIANKQPTKFDLYKASKTEKNPFTLHIGTSTGILYKRKHFTGISEKMKVDLSIPDAAQNIVVIGGIGAGKTTRIMQPLLVQTLNQDCGGLIFDVKGDFCQAVDVLAAKAGREVEIIGVHGRGINLLAGLSPEMASSFLKSAFYLSGGAHGDPFWIDTAVELCRNSFGVLSFVPGHYTLEGLYSYIFRPEDRERFMMLAQENTDITEQEKRLLRTYLEYYDMIYMNMGDKTIQGVNASVAQVLSPFQHPALVDSFCKESTGSANIEEVINGKIFLVDLPISQWGIGAKVIYTLIKLRFFNVMQSRPVRKELNQERPVFFMCDEYQDIISASKSGLSDLNFWDKSRSAKCIGIISSQSLNSFRSAIGDRALADTVLQNFRQKIFFRTEDADTIQYMEKLAGVAEVERLASGSTHAQISDMSTVDAALIRALGENYAIGFFNIDGRAADDVILLKPLYVDG